MLVQIIAFLRHDFLTNASYRTRAAVSLLGMLVTLVPMYFVATALQPFMAPSIQSESQQYFAFVLVGTIALRWMVTAVYSLPEAVAAAIRNGTLESLLGTPVSLGTTVVGMMAYKILWTALETTILLFAGLALGVRFDPGHALLGVVILGLLTAAYAAFGIIGACTILLFRMNSVVLNPVVLVSSLLGGVYYPTHVIPTWIEGLSAFVPLTYGLRALRKTLLEGMTVRAVGTDIMATALCAVVLLGVSLGALHLAVARARRSGSLAQY